MQNNFDPIDPEKVVVDNEPIDPEKVVMDRSIYTATSADLRRVRESFVGNEPLGFIANPDERFYVQNVTENFPDRDDYRKRLALAAYFTAHNKGADYRFVLGNLDSVLEQFYKKKTSVDAAFQDLSLMFTGPREDNWAGKSRAQESGTGSEYADAFLSGMTSFSANMAATFVKLGKWNVDFRLKLLSPLLPKKAEDFLKKYTSDALESYGRKIRTSAGEITSSLDRTSKANPDFITDLITGDFDKVSVHDFTKALIRSAPNMAFQLGLAAVNPWAAPAFIGVTTAADKDYEVNEKQPEWGEAKRLSYIGLSAASEALLETVTGKIVKGEMTREAAAKIIQKGLWKYIGKSFGKEAGTEAAQQLSANALDLLYDIEGDYSRLSGSQIAGRLFNGVLESGFIGGVWGVPYGAAGFKNTRQMMGAVEHTRAKHKARVETLAQKENLSAAEKAQLQTSQEILDNNSPQEILALDHISQKVDEANTEADIRESEEYKKALEESAPGTTEEEVIAAVKAERNLAFRATAEYDFDEVYARVSEIAADFKGVEFVTLDSWKYLPDDLRSVVGNRGRAFYNPGDGKVYLNASRVRPHEVLEVMLHEAVGHKGLRAVVPQKQLDEMLDKVYNAHFNDDDFQQLAARYFPETLQKLTDENGDEYVGPLLDTAEQQREAAEEYIAHIAQKGVPKPNWWKEFLQQIRMFFRRFKWAEDAVLLDSQIETVLARAARKVRKGTAKENLAVGEGVRYSIIGEEGAANLDHYLKQNNINNLAIAKEMLNSGKDAKTIKLATGWEKGGDGKWRMEIPDVEMKKTALFLGKEEKLHPPVRFSGYLKDIVEAPELFAAYPALMDYTVLTDDALPDYVMGRFVPGFKRILLRDTTTQLQLDNIRRLNRRIQKAKNWRQKDTLEAQMLGLESDPAKVKENAQKTLDLIVNAQLYEYRLTLIHEIQHGIQELEGFASGANVQHFVDNPILTPENQRIVEEKLQAEYEARKRLEDFPELDEDIRRYFSLEAEEDNLSNEDFELMGELHDKLESATKGLWSDFLQKKAERKFAQDKAYREKVSPATAYRNTAGEVEARNAVTRRIMSPEEKRQSLLADTADVAEESQIYIFGENGASELAEPFTEDQKRRILAISPRTGVDVIHKILYGGSITRNGNTVFFDGKNSHALKLHLDAPGFTPRRGPVTLEEFEKYLPRALAEKPRVESGKNKKNKKISNKIYKITDNDVIYTLVTASRGEFKSFYSNKKTANAVTDPNRSSATGMLPKHNISQNPENASGNLSDESDMPDVSDKLRFSLEEYSESEQEDIVAVLQPFVGRNIDMEPEKYREYLISKGIQIPDEDADVFFRMAVLANDKAARERANRLRDQWIYENFPIFAEVAEFAGGSDFKIKPVGHEGEDFTGSFISPAYVKYSVKASQGKRSEKQYRKYLADRKERLAAADGLAIDEVAEAVARKLGQDSDHVKEQILDFFRHLKKKELYSQYSQFKKDALALDKEAERQAREEFMQQEKFRIEDEAVQILTAGEPITPEWIAENPKVFKEVYKRIFNGKDAPATPSNIDIEAVNAALAQEGTTESFGPGYKEGKRAAEKEFRERLKAEREKAYEGYMEKLRQIRDQVVSDRANAVKLQRDAADFAAQHLPKENRAEFVKAITKLLELSPRPTAKFPEGQRKAAFDKLLARMTERAAEVRKEFYLDKIAKRLQQLGERVDGGRKVRGVRDIGTQEKLNRIIQISRLDGASLNAAITADQQAIENLIEQGENTAELEYDIALLNRYGELWNKSADEVKLAFDELQNLAKTGKDTLLKEIHSRAAADETDRNELWQAVNGGKRYSATELQRMANKRDQRGGFAKVLDSSFWPTLSLDGMLEAVALFSNKENVVDRFRRMAHKAKLDKDSLNMRNAQECRELLKNLTGAKNSIELAETIGKWREVKQESGVRRFVPDPEEQQFKYERVSVDEARRRLELYDSGRENMPDYEAEAIRQQLTGFDRKIKYEVPEEFRDGATDKLIELIKKDMDTKEPTVVIPHPTFKGGSEELELSQLQALYLKLMWEQKDIRYKMHYNGYSAETMAQVDKFLLPEVKEFGKWMVQQLELDRNGIARVYKEMYFANFPKEENYFPSLYRSTGNKVTASAVDLAAEGAAAGAIAYSPGALKVRVYHLQDLKIADALTVFQNHRLLMNHFVTHAEPARKLRSILLNSDIKQAIEGVHGMTAYGEMKTALKDFINGGNADVAVNDAGSHIYSAAVRAKMAFNLVSGLKQTLGTLTYLQEIPAEAFLSGFSYAATHPKEVFDTLGGTDYFKTRWNSGGNADLRLLLDSAGKQGSKGAQFIKNIDKIGSLPPRLGDAFSVLLGGFAVYKYHYDNLVRQGMKEAEARKEALLKWEMATERTQQSSSPFLLNKYQRGNYMARTFTTFMSNQILLWNHNSASLYKSLRYGDKAPLKDFRMGITALLLSSAAMTAFDQLKEHWNDGEYEWANLFWNALADMVSGFGPAGSITSSGIQALKPGGFGASPVWSELIYGGYAVKRLIFDEDASIFDKEWRDAVKILQAAGYFYEPAAQAGAVAREIRKWYRILTE